MSPGYRLGSPAMMRAASRLEVAAAVCFAALFHIGVSGILDLKPRLGFVMPKRQATALLAVAVFADLQETGHRAFGIAVSPVHRSRGFDVFAMLEEQEYRRHPLVGPGSPEIGYVQFDPACPRLRAAGLPYQRDGR